jgi:hypothetical protein
MFGNVIAEKSNNIFTRTNKLFFFDISRTTLIRDDMPLLQSINAKRFRTFGEMTLDFVKNQISYNYVGIGPIGKDKTFSTVTSSRQFARTSSRLKTSSGFTVSPERHFSLVV